MRSPWKQTRQLPFLMAALGDMGELVAAASDAGAMPAEAVAGLRGFVMGAVEDEIIAPLCQVVSK